MRTHAQVVARMHEIRDELAGITELAAPTADQERTFTNLVAEFDQLDRERTGIERDATLARIRASVAGAGGTRTERGAFGGDRVDVGADLALRSDESVAQWGARTGRGDFSNREGLSFDRLIRGLATGDWRGADAEHRAVSEGTTTAGGVLVPAPLSANLIDRARNAARVVAMGSTTVPMTSWTVKYPRLQSGFTPDWRNENAAINDKAITFDSITLTAQSLACMVKISWELFDDASGIQNVIEREFAIAFALELDRVALRGSGTTPEPRGLRNTTGVTVTAFGGANGATPTNYDFLIDGLQVLRAANYEPTGLLYAPRTETTLSKLKDTAGNYLAVPPALAGLGRASSNQLPTNLTVGTSTDTSEVYVGAWSNLLIGMRTTLRIRLLEERFADTGQFAFLADFRGDIGVAQPAAFNVIQGVRP